MSKLPLGSAIRKFEAEFDPQTGSLTKLNATPEEMPAVLELVEAQMSVHKMMSERIAANRREHELSQQSAVTTASLERAAQLTDRFVGDGAGIFLGEAFGKYAARQIRSGAWSDHTQKYTHEPSITLFRELVGNARPAPAESATVDPIIDIELASLTPSLVGTFLDEFWSFPARQGKTVGGGKRARTAPPRG